jgi:hypothetical protein
VTVAVLGAVACGPSAEDRAAVRAQDACISSLEPVADGRTPSADDLDAAVADAEAAAEVDDRWAPLGVLLRQARDQRGTPAFEPSVDALVAECEQVNDYVRAEVAG